MAEFRVVRSSRIEHVRGYVASEADRVHFQRLEAKSLTGQWVAIDEEIIPDHVIISLGAYGDNGGWVSKFAGYGPEAFARKAA